MNKLFPLLLVLGMTLFLACNNGGEVSVTPEQEPTLVEGDFNPGLLWHSGPAPDPSIPLPEGNRAWYVDSNAPDGGDGSEGNPYNNFADVIGGFMESNNWNYVIGSLRGGDHLYVAGEFMSAEGTDAVNTINCWRALQGGTEEEPTLITTWPGRPRAIFNGEGVVFEDHYDRTPIHFTNGGFYKVENIEIKNGFLYGIRAREGSSVEVVNCEIHHTHSTSLGGVGGGISVSGWTNDCTHKIYNNLLYENRVNTSNSGSITVLSEAAHTGNNVVEIFNNIIRDERTGIHHKHCGNIEFRVHHNLLQNCTYGVWNRAYKGNYYHYNIFLDCETAFLSSRENMQGDMRTWITRNTFANCPRIFTIESPDEGSYVDYYSFDENIIYRSSGPTIFLGYPSGNFNVSRWSSQGNIFYQTTGETFLSHSNADYSFDDAMALLSDTTSMAGDPLFSDAANNDFSLSASSPARGFGEDGNDVGALTYGSTYMMDQ